MKRYNLGSDGPVECAEGLYVLHDDVKPILQIKAEFEKLAKNIEDAKTECFSRQKFFSEINCPREKSHWVKQYECTSNLHLEITGILEGKTSYYRFGKQTFIDI